MTSPSKVGARHVAGLSSAEAARRLAEHGPNVVDVRRRRSPLARVAAQLRDPLILVLLGAAVLTLLTGDRNDTVIILAVVTLNTAVGVVQEVRADRAVAALAEMSAPRARAWRDGVQTTLPAAELVPGDVVLLEAGDVVPADGRLLEAPALQVDESALTGESVPVDKAAPGGPRPDKEGPTGIAAPGDGRVSAGTVVTRGRALVEVTETGADSALGRIAGLLAFAAGGRTPLQRRLAELGRWLALAAGVLCGVVLALGLLRGQPAELMVVTAVSLVVAAVPESLPAVVTLALALGARRMAARNAIVRSLPAVETLGSVSVLATDKTGTLTEGRMRAERVWTVLGETAVSDLADRRDPAVLAACRAGALCNDGSLPPGGRLDGAHGDPTEVALLALADVAGIDRAELAARLPRAAELPFDSVRRRMTTLHRAPDGSVAVVCKGAPEAVLTPSLLDVPDDVLAGARAGAERLAAEGLRVLALAAGERPELPEPLAEAERGLRLVGLVGLGDPPRPQAARAVAACRRAGIEPVLITGDHPATALAIARRLGIAGPADQAVTGESLYAGPVTLAPVYARIAPEQKLAIVAALQSQGRVVAMTGDGVNDGPALRRADIGVAMGRRGTEVAKQAADMVLADDDLGTVAAAVQEGRRVYANIRRFLHYGLAGGAAEILVMLLGPAAGFAVPLLPAQILWVNLMTHGLPGVALGAEPGEAGALDRRPRRPGESVLGAGLWQRVLLLGALLAAVTLAAGLAVGGGAARERTTMFLTLGLLQLGVALALRVHGAGGNPFLLVSVGGAAALQLAAVYVDPLAQVLGTVALPGRDLLTALALSTVGWVAVTVARAVSAGEGRGGPPALARAERRGDAEDAGRTPGRAR